MSWKRRSVSCKQLKDKKAKMRVEIKKTERHKESAGPGRYRTKENKGYNWFSNINECNLEDIWIKFLKGNFFSV